MSDVKITPEISEENPNVEVLRELYSHQHRDCWMCAEACKALEAGKALKEEQLWHFTNCTMSWEQIHKEALAEESIEKIEKAA